MPQATSRRRHHDVHHDYVDCCHERPHWSCIHAHVSPQEIDRPWCARPITKAPVTSKQTARQDNQAVESSQLQITPIGHLFITLHQQKSRGLAVATLAARVDEALSAMDAGLHRKGLSTHASLYRTSTQHPLFVQPPSVGVALRDPLRGISCPS